MSKRLLSEKTRIKLARMGQVSLRPGELYIEINPGHKPHFQIVDSGGFPIAYLMNSKKHRRKLMRMARTLKYLAKKV